MAPRETEKIAYSKFSWGDKKRALWYVMLFSGVVNRSPVFKERKLKNTMARLIYMTRKHSKKR